MNDKTKKVMILTVRHKQILYILAAFGVAKILDIAWLSGCRSISYAYCVIADLMQSGYVKSMPFGRGKIYGLTSKGYREIEMLPRRVEVNNNTAHDLDCIRVATSLYLEENVAFADFITDRQMTYLQHKKSLDSNTHRPDIVLGRDCYEIERTYKNLKILKRNILANRHYDTQMWLVPREKTRLHRSISEIVKDNLVDNAKVIYLEDYCEVAEKTELSVNQYRARPLLEARHFELVTETRNEDFYF